MEVFKEFRFEAAHSLPHLPEGHKCRNKHGHSYKVTVRCNLASRYLKANNGFVVDYADIAAAFEPVFATLDHHDIDEIVKPYSTCEYLAQFVWRELVGKLPHLSAIEIQETPSAGVRYCGD